jgi:anti-anti-sigma factor
LAAGRGEVLDGVLAAGGFGRTVLLDLARTDYINSTGLSWLILVHKRVAGAGGRLVLHSLSEKAQATLDLVSLKSVLCVVPDEESALALAHPAR